MSMNLEYFGFEMICSDAMMLRHFATPQVSASDSHPYLRQTKKNSQPQSDKEEDSQSSSSVEFQTKPEEYFESPIGLGQDKDVSIPVRNAKSDPPHRDLSESIGKKNISWSDCTRHYFDKTLTFLAHEEHYRQLKAREEKRVNEKKARQQKLNKELSIPRPTQTMLILHTLAHHSVSEALAETLKLSEFDLRFPFQSSIVLLPWMFKKEEKEVFILTRRSLEPGFLFIASISFLHHPADVVWKLVSKMRNRLHYNRHISDVRLVEKIDADNEIWYMEILLKRFFMAQRRDFVLLATRRQIDHRRLICNRSVSYSKCPIQPNIPRGNIRVSAYQVEPFTLRNVEGSRVIFVLQIHVPNLQPKLLEHMMMSQATTLANLRTILEQRERSKSKK